MDECMEILFRRFGKDELEQRTNEFFKHDEDGDNNISFVEFQRQARAVSRPPRTRSRTPRTPRHRAPSTWQMGIVRPKRRDASRAPKSASSSSVSVASSAAPRRPRLGVR